MVQKTVSGTRLLQKPVIMISCILQPGGHSHVNTVVPGHFVGGVAVTQGSVSKQRKSGSGYLH